MKKLILTLFVLLVILARINSYELDLEEEVYEEFDLSSGSLYVSFDTAQTNQWWIQIKVSPSQTVKDIQFICPDGSSVMLYSPSWDANKEIFTGKPQYNPIYNGQSVQLKINLVSGSVLQTSISYNQGTATLSLPTSGGTGGNTGGTGTDGPASTDPQILKFINEVHKYSESQGYQTGIKEEDSLLRYNKGKLLEAIRQLGINDIKTRAFLFSIFTVESEQMYYSNGVAQRDTSKDWDSLSKNVSPCNMNVDMIKNYVHYTGNVDNLNYLSHIKETIKVVVSAVDKLGLYGFLNFHRGGRTGYLEPRKYEQQYQMDKFRIGVYNIMKIYLQDTSLFFDGRKVWAYIPYV